MIDNHAETHCKPRLDKVIAGEQGGVSEAVSWTGGGGDRFYRLGAAVFDTNGHIADGIAFATPAAHIWFSETRTPSTGLADTPVLGVHDGTVYTCSTTASSVIPRSAVVTCRPPRYSNGCTRRAAGVA